MVTLNTLYFLVQPFLNYHYHFLSSRVEAKCISSLLVLIAGCIFQEAEYVIIIEEDLDVSPDFFL